MSFLSAICFVVACAFAGELQILGAGTDGQYYNCSKLTAKDGCIQTYWCVWATGAGGCIYDECLKWINDNQGDADCTGDAALMCKAFYMKDNQIDCADGKNKSSDRFCRTTNPAYDKAYLTTAEGQCFYEDLKALGNGGSRSCGYKTCSWMNTSNGQYCTYGGGEDCTGYAEESSEFCACLGKDYCELHPRCRVSSNNCILDPCSDCSDLHSGTAGGPGKPCYQPNGITPCDGCVGRSEWYWNTVSGAVEARTVCVTESDGKKRNECYYAIKYTVADSPWKSGNDSNNICVTVTYDETVCTSSQVFDESASPPAPKSDSAKCQLVPIAPGYLGNDQYCTDGERTVPAPNTGSLVRVPSVIALMLTLLAALLL